MGTPCPKSIPPQRICMSNETELCTVQSEETFITVAVSICSSSTKHVILRKDEPETSDRSVDYSSYYPTCLSTTKRVTNPLGVYLRGFLVLLWMGYTFSMALHNGYSLQMTKCCPGRAALNTEENQALWEMNLPTTQGITILTMNDKCDNLQNLWRYNKSMMIFSKANMNF